MGPNAFFPKLSDHPGIDSLGRRYDPESRHATAQLYGRHPDPLAAETLMSVLGATRAIADHLERCMATEGLSMSRFMVLLRLWQTEDGQAPLHEIADWCSVSPRNITGLVDGLAAGGLVERIAHRDDRRITLARLTAAGSRLVERVAGDHWAEQTRLVADLDEGERRTLIDLSVRLAAQAGSLNRSPAAPATGRLGND